MSHELHSNQAYLCDSETMGPETSSSVVKTKYGALEAKTGFNKLEMHKNDEKFTQDLEDTTGSNKKNEDRDAWSNQLEFVLCTVNYAVGIGNVWRFPYLVYKNGGGSFLIPYFISQVFIGFPMFFMELALGQFSGQGPASLYGRLAPLFSGLGWAMVGCAVFVSLYYNVIVGWTLFYIFKGFAFTLPWSSCTFLSSYHCYGNFSNQTSNDKYAVGPSEDFFLHQMLRIDKAVHTWGSYGHLEWRMVLCLLGAWTIVCLCLIKGVQSAGKVS